MASVAGSKGGLELSEKEKKLEDLNEAEQSLKNE